MDLNSILTRSQMQLITQSPLGAVCVVGLILALAFWGRCPRASLLTLIATGLLLLSSVAFTLLQVFFLYTMRGAGWTSSELGLALTVVDVARSLARAAAVALLLAAVFSDRPLHSPSESPADSPMAQ